MSGRSRGVASSEESVDAIVLGAGISGLVSTSILLRQGASSVTVVDSYDHVGGNHIDVEIGGYTFDVGSLVFQDDSPLLNHFPELMDQYLPVEPSWSRLNPQGIVTQYPFSVRDDLVAAGPAECARILGSLMLARARRRRLQNAREFAEHWIGPRLSHRAGLTKYMERFCGLPAEDIELEFAEKRMGWIPEQASVRAVARRLLAAVRRTPATAAPTNRQVVRPREGFSRLYEPSVARLEASGARFLLGRAPDAARRVPGGFMLELGDRRIRTSRLVSTIPLDRAAAICGLPSSTPLPSVTLVTLFFSFAGRRGFAESILYNFSHEGSWKRLTVYSDFYGAVGGREYFAVEVVEHAGDRPHEGAEADFRAHTAANALFDGDLRLEGHHLLEHAYPVFTDGAGARAASLVRALREFGVESFGRQGGFQYQPTARVSTHEAEVGLAGPRPS